MFHIAVVTYEEQKYQIKRFYKTQNMHYNNVDLNKIKRGQEEFQST